MRILFYGRLGEMIGRETRIELETEDCTVAMLRRLLGETHPYASDELRKPSVRACIGDTFVGEDHRLGKSDCVEFFPPLSGG